MHMHAKIEVFQSITPQEDISEIRKLFGEAVKAWAESGKLLYSGIFANKRGAFSFLTWSQKMSCSPWSVLW